MIRSCDVLDKTVPSFFFSVVKINLCDFQMVGSTDGRMRTPNTGVRAILNIDSEKYLKNDQNRTRETNMATQR